MNDLSVAWEAAEEFLRALPVRRAPVFHLGIHTDAVNREPIVTGYISLQMTPSEQGDNPLRFWTHHVRDGHHPAGVIAECLEAARDFLSPKAKADIDPFS